MDGPSINTESHMHLQPLFSFHSISLLPFYITEHLSVSPTTFFISLSSMYFYFLTSLHSLSGGLLTALNLIGVALPPGLYWYILYVQVCVSPEILTWSLIRPIRKDKSPSVAPCKRQVVCTCGKRGGTLL